MLVEDPYHNYEQRDRDRHYDADHVRGETAVRAAAGRRRGVRGAWGSRVSAPYRVCDGNGDGG